MDYGFKPTTNGRALLAACAATGSGLNITRVAVGSGMVPDGTNLADVHELCRYVANGTIAQRSHEDDRIYLTIQYSNESPEIHKSIPTFTLAEFMVYAEHPETGEETDLLYGTLGNYCQPVPAFQSNIPASVFSFPLVLAISDEIEVTISTEVGLVTFVDLENAMTAAMRNFGGIVKTLPFNIGELDWQISQGGNYRIYADIVSEDINSTHIPDVVLARDSQDIASSAGMCATAESFTGYVRLWAKEIPEGQISGVLYLCGKGGFSGGVIVPATCNSRGLVMIGDGINVDSEGRISVDRQTVLTDGDMLNEAETEQALRTILLGEPSGD